MNQARRDAEKDMPKALGQTLSAKLGDSVDVVSIDTT
jgi:ethanolamine utilization protein EutA (predicted chaperonin)